MLLICNDSHVIEVVNRKKVSCMFFATCCGYCCYIVKINFLCFVVWCMLLAVVYVNSSYI